MEVKANEAFRVGEDSSRANRLLVRPTNGEYPADEMGWWPGALGE